MATTAKTKIDTPAKARKVLEPIYWIEHFLGSKPWSKQKEICQAVKKHKHVAVRSCHGAGKDWIAARIVLWFVFAHKPVRVISTGPTDRQVKGILWKEVNIAFKGAKADLAGKPLTQEFHLSEDRFALGFTTSKSATTGETGGSKFSGWHARHMLVVVDEASGVEKDVYTELSGVLSSENAHLLEIGNPTNPTGEFASAFKQPGVHKIKISAFDTPNFTEFGITQEDIENDTWKEKITGPLPYPELITPQWVAERFKKWGLKNPLYQSRVLAEFPSAGVDTLIPLYRIEEAHKRELQPVGENVLGVDPARYGSNMMVIAHRKGQVIRIIERIPKCSITEAAGYVIKALRDTKAEKAAIDTVGLGAGVYDSLREQGYPVIEAVAGANALNKDDFSNARAEWYGLLRDDCESGNIDLDESDEDLTAQLSDIKWKPDSKGRLVIESKEDMMKRGVASPDDADAAAMTYCRGTPVPKILTPSDVGSRRSMYDRPAKMRW